MRVTIKFTTMYSGLILAIIWDRITESLSQWIIFPLNCSKLTMQVFQPKKKLKNRWTMMKTNFSSYTTAFDVFTMRSQYVMIPSLELCHRLFCKNNLIVICNYICLLCHIIIIHEIVIVSFWNFCMLSLKVTNVRNTI